MVSGLNPPHCERGSGLGSWSLQSSVQVQCPGVPGHAWASYVVDRVPSESNQQKNVCFMQAPSTRRLFEPLLSHLKPIRLQVLVITYHRYLLEYLGLVGNVAFCLQQTLM
jgi:hypothetical protein